MSKFEEKKEALRKSLAAQLAKVEEEEKEHARKVIKPLAGKFAALIEEEVEKLGSSNLEAVEDYRFKKAELRLKIRAFVESEFGQDQPD